MIFFSGALLAFNYWNSRKKHFGRLSVARVFQSVTTTSTQLGSGYIGYGNGGSLIGASVAGFTMSSLALAGQIWREDSHLLRQNINWFGIRQALKRYSKFPLYDTWASLLNIISWQLPTLLLSNFFSASVVGYYALAFRLISLPMNFIGRSIGQVFFQRASVAKSSGKLAEVVEETFSHLVKVSMFPILILTLTGQDIFVLAFGEQWRESGIYVQILGGWSFFWFIASPISTLFTVLERQQDLLYIQTGIFISRLLSLSIGGYFFNEKLALALFSISGIFLYGYKASFAIYISGVKISVIFQKVLSELLLFIPVGILLISMYSIKVSTVIIVIINSLILIIYYLYLLLNKKLKIKHSKDNNC